jgi:hypothetical protein
MRLSWIQRHWEPEYIADAEEKIRATVRLLRADFVYRVSSYS